MTYRLESIANKVNILSDYQIYKGNPNFIRSDIYRYNAVTRKDIMRVYEVYVKSAHCVVASICPKGHKELIAAADNYTAGGDSSKLTHQDYDLKPQLVNDNFNRKNQPKKGPEPVMNVPQHFSTTDNNWMQATGVANNEIPVVYFEINIKAGQNLEMRDKAGLAYLASRMLQESTVKMSGEELSAAFERLGADVSVRAGKEYITVSAHCLKKNMDNTILLINEMLTSSKFDPEDFKRVKDETLQLIANQSVRADALADNAFSNLIYGNENPYGNSILGTKETVENITVADVQLFLQMNMSLKTTHVYASGDIDGRKLGSQMVFFQGWTPRMAPEMPMIKPKPIEKTKIYLVNKENAPQSEIRIGYLALPWDSTGDFFKANIMNYTLGGSFNSRLNLFLREKKGYTYGIRSGFDGNHTAGPFTVSAGVKGDITDSAVMDAMEIIKKFADKGITKKELKFTKNALLDREALKYETNAQKVAYIERMVDYNLSENYVNEQENVLKHLKRREINRIAKHYLPTDKMAIVVVGDAKSLKDKLSKLGYEVVEVQGSSSSMTPGNTPGPTKKN